MYHHNREFIRHPADIPIGIHVEAEAYQSNHTMHTVSEGGLSIHCPMYMEPGTFIKLNIPVNPAFEAEAEVVWCEEAGDEYDIGVQFLEIDDAYKARMVEQVCHIEHYKNETRTKEGRILTGEEAANEWIKKFASDFTHESSCGKTHEKKE